MNIRKSILVVEKSTREILCYSLIPKFKHISIKLFFICYNKKNHAFLNKKDILKVIY
jgi:hypothetical protein